MVVFTCGHCGESVQKPKVEKHYLTVCRNRQPNLSCMDCFKDFLGNEYEAHTKCITEEERYSGKGFTAKEKKGEKKQNAWVEMVQSVLDEQKSASKNVLRIIETISKHNNTPRKKPKFVNFVKNVCGHKTNPKDIDQAWELISVKLAALSKINEQNRTQSQEKEKAKTNGHSEDKDEDDDNEEKKTNGDTEHDTTEEVNGVEEKADNEEKENGVTEQENPTDKKLSKKQRKEEKKRKKYEAELQSAVQPPDESEEVEVHKTKKEKKKNRSNSINDENVAPTEGKNKNKKRKRQDTVGAISDSNDNQDVEVKPVKKEIEKKKLKVDGEDGEGEESICLHDQNVAKIEEENTNNGKFNWHAAIMSVLQKKDNEVPFKRLQKKVLAEYAEATGCDIDDRIADKFIKKLKSAPNVRVDKNRVLLLTDE